jgi:hypothetical protein
LIFPSPELPDSWNAEQSPVKDGVTFNAKYLGSILVEELEDEAQSYGHSICAEAVKSIHTMVRSCQHHFLLISTVIIFTVESQWKAIATDEHNDIISRHHSDARGNQRCLH